MSTPVHPSDHSAVEPYRPRNHVRIVTAASLFDGHDAAINIMRRILQASGAEVIHLGHNRSVKEIVDCAIQEDAQGIALTSYQGGHTEYLKYMHDLLQAGGRSRSLPGWGHHPARGDRGAASPRDRPDFLPGRRPRIGIAGHDQPGHARVRFCRGREARIGKEGRTGGKTGRPEGPGSAGSGAVNFRGRESPR